MTAEPTVGRETSSGPERTAPATAPVSRRRTVLLHSGLLLVVLGFFRLEKGLQLVPPARSIEWLALLLPEVGFVALFAAFWLLAARLRRRRGRLWAPLFHGSVVAIYLVSLLDHLWFLYTGTRLHLALVVYSARYFEMLIGLLGSGVNLRFWVRLALVALCYVLALRLERLGRAAAAQPTRRLALVAAAFGLLVLLPSWPVPYRVADLWSTAAVELFAGIGLEAPEGADLVPYLVAPDELHRAPRVTGLPQERPPNVVLLLLESTRRDLTPPWADTALAPVMPHLATLAPATVAFDDVYSSVSHTSKALVGILCGMFPRLDMPIVEALPGGLDLPCLPRLLGEAGYRTAFFQTAPGKFEQRPGLVANLGYAEGGYGENFLRPPFERMGYLGLDEHAMLEPAVGWAAASRERPFFLTVLTVAPHHPYEVPGERGRWLGETREQYMAALHHQDRFLGALLSGLGRRGLLQDTIVVILGDHGEAFGEHRRFQHDAVPYQEVIHVPLLLLGPEERIGPPRRVGGLRHQVDLLPTLLDLAGVEWEGAILGRSLLTSPGHERIFSFCWYREFCMAMVEERYKYVYHFGRRPLEVFDLRRDPGENRDLADDLPEEQVTDALLRMAAMERSVERFWELRQLAAPSPASAAPPAPTPNRTDR